MSGRPLSGRIAVVTGASRGIGRAIALALSDRGARVLGCSRGDRPDNLPDAIEWVSADVAKSGEVADICSRALAMDGVLSVLVNNAGVQPCKPIHETSDGEWTRCVDINCRGVFNTCREFLPRFISIGGGTIINIGSVAADRADSGLPLYNATKGFVHSLTRSIALDHGPSIRCNAVSPGWIDTGMMDEAFNQSADPVAARRDAEQRHPSGRFGTPEDVARAVCWLASDESGFVNGECLRVDGGLSATSSVRPDLY